MANKIATLDYIKSEFNLGGGGKKCVTPTEVRALGLKVAGDRTFQGFVRNLFYQNNQLVPEREILKDDTPQTEGHITITYYNCDKNHTYCSHITVDSYIPRGSQALVEIADYVAPNSSGLQGMSKDIQLPEGSSLKTFYTPNPAGSGKIDILHTYVMADQTIAIDSVYN